MKATGPGRDREWKLRERDGSGIDHCGTGTGTGMTTAGTGRDREQRTSPVQNSTPGTSLLASQIQHLLTLCLFINCIYLLTYNATTHVSVSIESQFIISANLTFIVLYETEKSAATISQTCSNVASTY